eukprot:GHVQ01012103.1.p2 GENE.GHVQ01012103.1~~GHVQ01012103.1.p2  ORF type:complete len:254 (+),score=19.47 GHVQ01012103.1:2216-2977(+)
MSSEPSRDSQTVSQHEEEVNKLAEMVAQKLTLGDNNPFRKVLSNQIQQSLSKDFQQGATAAVNHVLDEQLQSKLKELEKFIESSKANTATHEMRKRWQPEPFKGTRDSEVVENFIFELHQYLILTGISLDEVAVATWASFLKEWRFKCQKDGTVVMPHDIKTPQAFYAWLRRRCAPTDPYRLSLYKLDQLKMKPGMAANEYSNRFKELTLRLGLRDSARMHIYEKGLTPMIWTESFGNIGLDIGGINTSGRKN